MRRGRLTVEPELYARSESKAHTKKSFYASVRVCSAAGPSDKASGSRRGAPGRSARVVLGNTEPACDGRARQHGGGSAS